MLFPVTSRCARGILKSLLAMWHQRQLCARPEGKQAIMHCLIFLQEAHTTSTTETIESAQELVITRKEEPNFASTAG